MVGTRMETVPDTHYYGRALANGYVRNDVVGIVHDSELTRLEATGIIVRNDDGTWGIACQYYVAPSERRAAEASGRAPGEQYWAPTHAACQYFSPALSYAHEGPADDLVPVQFTPF